MKTFALAILALSLLQGCYYGHMDFEEKTLTRFALFYDAEFESAEYDPSTGLIRLQGYKSDTSAALEALDKTLGLLP